MKTPLRRSGFTIIELLIVIVVIAILAAITIVAYNGIQDRAEAVKTAGAVRAYKTALSLYKVDNGTYPVTGAMCLGDQYPTFTGGLVNACRNSAQEMNDETNAAGRNLLKPYLGGQLPMPSSKHILAGGDEFIGAHFYGSDYDFTLDGVPVVMIEYFVKGDSCPVGPIYDGGTQPDFFSPAVEQSGPMSGDASRCYLPLPEN